MLLPSFISTHISKYICVFDGMDDHHFSASPSSLSLSMRGQELHWAMAHMLVPLSILKYPAFPQASPQEFLMFQKLTPPSLPYPVAKTAWFTSWVVLPQFSTLQTPVVQALNPATTWKETAMGPALQRRSASSTSSPWVTLKDPWRTQPIAMDLRKTHWPSLAVQGQVTSDSIPPAWRMYSKAWEGRPPLQPWLSKSPAQSTNCCSEKVMLRPLPSRFQWDSREPTVEKVQQDPQEPWFLTGVTIPQFFHSQESGMALRATSSLTWNLLVAEHSWGFMRRCSANSSWVISVKSLMPWRQECLPMLWFLISMRDCAKILKRSSDLVVQAEWYCEQISRAVDSLQTVSPSMKERQRMFNCRFARETASRQAISRIFDILLYLSTGYGRHQYCQQAQTDPHLSRNKIQLEGMEIKEERVQHN